MSDFEFIYTLNCEACDELFPNQGVPVFFCPHCGSGTDAITDPEIRPIDVRGVELMRAEHGAMNLANVEHEKEIERLTVLLAQQSTPEVMPYKCKDCSLEFDVKFTPVPGVKIVNCCPYCKGVAMHLVASMVLPTKDGDT